MSTPLPFRFKSLADPRSYVDRDNGLRLQLYQWPEYYFTIGVQPVSGDQAEAWPVAQRAYFEFSIAEKYEDGIRTLSIGVPRAHTSFECDYPGRADELLEAVVPLLSAVFEHNTGRSADRVTIASGGSSVLLK